MKTEASGESQFPRNARLSHMVRRSIGAFEILQESLAIGLQHNFFWILIVAPAEKCRLAQLLIFSPLRKRYFAQPSHG
jgi:hypothetical protein